MTRRPRIPGTPRRPPGSTLFVLPEIRDDLPDDLKNALAIRNACAIEGRCPVCHVEPRLTIEEPGLGHLTFEHEDWCPVLRDHEVEA